MDVGGWGDWRLCPVTFSVKNRGKFRLFDKNFLIKVYKIQHFHKCIYILSINVCSL